MNTFAYMGRLLSGWALAVAMVVALPAFAGERKTPEIALKKTSDCDSDLSRYASEGHGGTRVFIAREVKKSAPTKPQVRISARGGLTFTASAK